MKMHIGIAEQDLSQVSSFLNQVLADETILFTKTRKAHWNVSGPNFMELHKFFQSQYEALDATIDEVAERIRSLGQLAPGSLNEFLHYSTLKETKTTAATAQELIHALLEDHESLIRELRVGIVAVNDTYHDVGTGDFLTGILEQHEKMAWMLRAYLQ